MTQQESLKEALILAEGIIGYCGDAWERECTANDRKRFYKIYNKFFPPKKEKLGPMEPVWCDVCKKYFANNVFEAHCNGKRHLNKKKQMTL